MTKRKLTKHEDDVRRGLRKSAEINPSQSTQGLRDTIEEQTGRYVVEINDWGCGTMIKDTLTGKEIDAPAEETVNLCLAEMNRLATEVESVRQVAQDNKTETEATRIENDRLKAEVERLKAMDSLKTVSLTDSTNWQAIGDYAETKEENARLNNYIERLEVRNAVLVPENACLKADCKDWRAINIRMMFTQVERSNETISLKAEVERLDTLCKQLGKQHSDISCENIMLRKANDSLARVIDQLNAAKEGKKS